MRLVVFKGIEDTEQHQACSRNQPGKQRNEACDLSPFRIIGQSIEFVRVTYVMDGKHRAGKRDASDGTASYKYWLKDEGANITDKR